MRYLIILLLLLASPAQAQLAARAQTQLGITGSAVVVKPANGNLITITVTTAGSAPGSVNDSATTGGVAASNLIATIPNTVGIYYIPFTFLNGLVVTPGTAQIISVCYQ
jgi:hypothetical protein